LSRRGLAEVAGLSAALITRIERGEHRDPRLSTLRRLASAFHISSAELVRRLDDQAADGFRRGRRITPSTAEGEGVIRRRTRGTRKGAAAIGGCLRQLRNQAGQSQHEMAVAAGVSDFLISRIERGSRYDPRLTTLMGFARALKVSTAALVRELER
jgi:transcriptional regulator with XRE-family HTH domain